MLCDIASACDLATVDCIMMVEMVHMLAKLLESAADRCEQTHCLGEEFYHCSVSVFRTAEIMHYFYLNLCCFMFCHLFVGKLQPQSHKDVRMTCFPNYTLAVLLFLFLNVYQLVKQMLVVRSQAIPLFLGYVNG